MDDVVYRSPNDWLVVKRSGEYHYSERLGKDSVSIVLYRRSKGALWVMLHSEYVPPHHDRLWGAIGGSLDKDKPIDEIVIEEVLEEAGYTVTTKRLTYLGKIWVSTQTNEVSHMYVVDVTGLTQGTPLEEGHEFKWVKFDTNIVKETEDSRFLSIAMHLLSIL